MSAVTNTLVDWLTGVVIQGVVIQGPNDAGAVNVDEAGFQVSHVHCAQNVHLCCAVRMLCDIAACICASLHCAVDCWVYD